ncbi:alkaline phosphatase [Actinoplanes cyaneus]|uniref:Alkaline phosphatase n=1 Tax=Actinoplanes cyaneus TaxID=52696 RepID=A0A919LXX4_9ACTN|nr:alkaline phosphatase [Actinoplanes cyaneus]MCW2143539.1 alkaline phosphatase [Actinoplanes cyaneus]GID62375.1 alkaline phosphatase [Actinoplanes cyaneus]
MRRFPRRHGLRTVAVLAAASVIALPAVTVAADAHPDRSAALDRAIMGGRARNVILMIGDGMGDSEITIARNYQVGAAGRLAMDTLPFTGDYTTYSVVKDSPGMPDYAPDSASTATAWSIGRKTYDGAVGVLPDGQPAPTLLELAKRAGYRTGNVTTAELQDATPAAAAAHVVHRNCKGPDSMAACPQNASENGGAGSIAEQLIKTGPDVLLGGGMQHFGQTVRGGPDQGRTVLEQAQRRGYRLVTDRAGLAAARPGEPLLGVFAPNNLAPEWQGPLPSPQNTPPTRCVPYAGRVDAEPHLTDLTDAALRLLDRGSAGSRKGFFLQIEGAAIDKADHDANPCYQVGETVAFDAAIAKVLAYQRSHPDTLVVVTADHGHTSQIVEAGSVTPGLTATLRTNEGGDLTINYATSPAGTSQQHTGTQVRIAATGPQAANVTGITDQTDLFFTVKRALGLR